MYNILSPDGFSIHHENTYKTINQAKQAFKKWLSQYKIQGYYSSVDFGRIPLCDVENYCTLIKI